MERIARLAALAALFALALAAAYYALPQRGAMPPAAVTPAAAQTQTYTDYDVDDDGLIEIASLTQLNAIRWDPDGNGNPYAAHTSTYDDAFPNRNPYPAGRMGCIIIACFGYELTADLDFDTNNDNTVDANDQFPDWDPLPAYSGLFNGNGHTVNRLTIGGARAHAGLFGVLEPVGRIRNIGITNPNVSSAASGAAVGALIARSYGLVTAAYSTGGSVSLTAPGSTVGGLIGVSNGRLRAAYSTSTVASVANSYTGGLVGRNGGQLAASYAAAAAINATTTGSEIGGLAGWYDSLSEITDSYCATAPQCIGNDQLRGRSAQINQTTTPLQTPAGYTGIYANWNVDTDGDSLPDDPWVFGDTSTYPTLKFPGQNATDYDADDDRLIEISSLDQLNAVRWDLTGDGYPESASNSEAYLAAFPGADFTSRGRMGCFVGICVGYELTADLDFDTNGDNVVNNSDDYPNWAPLGGGRLPAGYVPHFYLSQYDFFSGAFEGNGHTIANMTMNRTGQQQYGLFGYLAPGGQIRNLGVINASVTAGGSDYNTVGILVGYNRGTISVGYVQGGSVAAAVSNMTIGGLVGSNSGLIYASYSTASVSKGGFAINTVGGLVGANLRNAAVHASYTAGPVTGPTTGPGFVGALGGFVGSSETARSVIIDSYCDVTVIGTSTNCIGARYTGNTAVAATATTAALQTPTSYTGIYENWNIDVNGDGQGDSPWQFGTTTTYPTPRYTLPQEAPPPPPPPQNPITTTTPPTATTTPMATTTNPMATTTNPMATSTNPGGNMETSTPPGNGGSTTTPPGNGGSTTTNPMATSTNPGGNMGTTTPPGNGGATTTNPGGNTGTTTSPGNGGATTTPPGGNSEPVGGNSGENGDPPRLSRGYADAPSPAPYNPDTAHPEIYVNTRWGMSATCETAAAGGGSTVAFDLGRYTRPITLILSLWNGRTFQTYQGLDLAQPPLTREGQAASVEVTTTPSQTRFRLDGISPTVNLLLGYADCHTDDG